MDRFSVLSDELLIKILSFVPTKVAVSTSVLSKRWKYLWMWLPRLEFGNKRYSSSEYQSLKCFLNRNLPLHRAPVLESFHLDLKLDYEPDGIKRWIEVAISHYLRELEVFYNCYLNELDGILPSNLYTCKSLVILKLSGWILLDIPLMVFLPSLKTLHLKRMRYFSKDSLQLLLSNCPILEDLRVDLESDNILGELTVVASSLQRLSLYIPPLFDIGGGIVIKTTSLKYFKLVCYKNENHYCLVENMPNLIEAYVEVRLPNIQSFIGSLTSVKHLTICSKKAMYYGGFVFNQLQHLQLCECNKHLSDLLVRLLNGSPHLQVLDIFEMDNHRRDELFYWNQPSTIPECLLSSLQIFKWNGYKGTPGERDLAIYMLKNASHLRIATIKYYDWTVPKFEMIKELTLTSRASTTCQLVFEPVLED